MGRLGGSVLGGLMVLSLVGCASTEVNADGTLSSEALVVSALALPNGKTVECVHSVYTGSVVLPDCDWAGASADREPTEAKSLGVYTVEAGRGIVYCVASTYTGSVVDPDCDWGGLAKK